MRRAWLTTLPLLLLVGLGLVLIGWKTNLRELVGAGLVLVGMWSGTAVADLFTVIAKPAVPSDDDPTD